MRWGECPVRMYQLQWTRMSVDDLIDDFTILFPIVLNAMPVILRLIPSRSLMERRHLDRWSLTSSHYKPDR
jgi:hypothetical protein